VSQCQSVCIRDDKNLLSVPGIELKGVVNSHMCLWIKLGCFYLSEFLSRLKSGEHLCNTNISVAVSSSRNLGDIAVWNRQLLRLKCNAG